MPGLLMFGWGVNDRILIIYLRARGEPAPGQCQPAKQGRQKLPRTGVVEIPIVDPTTEFNYGSVSIDTGFQGAPVQLVTIGSLNLAKCDFIKADMEGIEADTIDGACQTITKYRPIFFLENDKPGRQAPLYEKEREIGYQDFWQISSHYNPENYDIFEPYKPSVNITCLPPGATTDGYFQSPGG
jgi:hypothetical protein